MKKITKAAFAAALSLVMLFAAACGQEFDAKGYVDSVMKMMTQGDVSDYVKYSEETQEEAEATYQELPDTLRETLIGSGISEDSVDKFVDAYLTLIKETRYTVHDAVKTDDGYTVDVDIEPVVFDFDAMMDEITVEATEAYTSGEITSEEEMYVWVFDKIAEKMLESVDAPSYGEAQTLTFTLVKNGDVYEIKDQEQIGEKLGLLLFSLDGLTE